ncbi:MAG TPA: RpiB/LacA/LacB family sugar-phosphate isomerase [Smithella sp.]|nr:RpiB/LacA/LacB family sugar-phosphate isomerase [Smithella sp.]HRS97172.1 RpiB/LacA/LacB family sugar-phosphate isomerase [Smithella sp.]
MKKIIIASDHGAVSLKKDVADFLLSRKCDVKDLGVNSNDSVDYPDIAAQACEVFNQGGYDFGILLCGTGIGMTIAANKIKGIRCALIHDLFTAKMAKEHNDANFIAFGGRVKYDVPVTEMIETFMASSFAGDRHLRRIVKIANLEK